MPSSSRADGDGGTTAGVVLPLDLVGTGIYDATYTVPVSIGGQQFSLQIDTGSSDLWVASVSCSSSPCAQTAGHNYDPSLSGSDTGHNFEIQYLSGTVSGPIYWDRVHVGGYSVEFQALAAATSVTGENLSPNFNGILGLALPLNSIIAETIPPVTNNTPDGAAWASNLFSITPTSNAPSSRFLSLSLSRPGSSRIPSFLGIGSHPPDLVQDNSLIHYYSTVSDAAGSLFWKTNVRDITVWVDGQSRLVDIGRSKTGAVFPSAVIDSGVPYILTTTQVANAIYGAIDVHPAQDGNYYVPCHTPLNLSITLDNRPPFSIHPLDLTAEPPQDNNADFCIGMIQAADSQLTDPTSDVGDMILGIPFMRNVYTIMAYTVPTDDGAFPPISDSKVNILVQPRLGLMSLTNSTVALDEFNTVRILNQPLSDGPVDADSGSQGGGKKLSTGIIVLIALLGFFTFCCFMFIVRSLVCRRQFYRRQEKGHQTDYKHELAYQLTHHTSGSIPSENTLRTMRYEEYLKKNPSLSSSKKGTLDPSLVPDEFGARSRLDGDTLVAVTSLPSSSPVVPTAGDQELIRHSKSLERYHRRTPSEVRSFNEKTRSDATPLLSEDSHSPPECDRTNDSR